jgi:hypothetical protein
MVVVSCKPEIAHNLAIQAKCAESPLFITPRGRSNSRTQKHLSNVKWNTPSYYSPFVDLHKYQNLTIL